MEINIFLDDLRMAPNKYNKVFRDGESFIAFLNKNKNVEINILSLDHDLGEDKMSGYDVVKELGKLDLFIKKIQLHTDNSQGFKNMLFYLVNLREHGLFKNYPEIEYKKINVIDGKETIAPYTFVSTREIQSILNRKLKKI